MSTVAAPPSRIESLADLMDRLGGVPLARVRFRPPPGTATEADLLAVAEREGVVCELVEGTLVEKPVGLVESVLASLLIEILNTFVRAHNLGIVPGEQGAVRLLIGLVRIPDVAFISWDRVPGRRMPTEAIPGLVPDLAVEVLSRSNTPGEVAIKLQEYFQSGVRLVWVADPTQRTVTVYSSPTQFVLRTEADVLDGAPVLPGFTLAVRDWFAELDRHG
jgi:Uma2 family endonuclease